MPEWAPWGYRHRSSKGVRGMLGRWWYRWRVWRIRRAQSKVLPWVPRPLDKDDRW